MTSLKKSPLTPLNSEVLGRLFSREYVNWINDGINILSGSSIIRNYVYQSHYIGGGLRKIGLHNKTIKAYFAYLTIKPLEMALKQSIAAENL